MDGAVWIDSISGDFIVASPNVGALRIYNAAIVVNVFAAIVVFLHASAGALSSGTALLDLMGILLAYSNTLNSALFAIQHLVAFQFFCQTKAFPIFSFAVFI